MGQINTAVAAGMAPLGPTWPLSEDMWQHPCKQGCLCPRGLLSYVPAHSRSAGSAMPWQGLAPLPPCVWRGQSTSRILPPWPSDCLVLQLSLPLCPRGPAGSFLLGTKTSNPTHTPD